jgi:hypothetical protein
MTTIAEINQQIALLKAKKAVFRSLADYVQTHYFAPEDADPDQVFETDEGAPVPQVFVLEAMSDIVDKVTEYDLEIRKLESLEIAPPALPAQPPTPVEEEPEEGEELEEEEVEEETEVADEAPVEEPAAPAEGKKEKGRGKAHRQSQDRPAA